MSKRLFVGLLILFVIAACGAPPAPVAAPPAAAAVAVDPPAAAPAAAPAEGAEMDAGNPGPIPVSVADPAWGNRDAPVTIVEFSDFQCPFCARANGTLAQIQQAYGPDRLRIVWKNYPLEFHAQARPAAVAAMALFVTGGNDAFWGAHRSFFDDQRKLGALVEQASAGLQDPGLRRLAEAKVDADVALAKEIGVTGTPAFFINGVYLSGARAYEEFAGVIDDQLTKAKAQIAAGTSPRRVYAELTTAQYKKEPPKVSIPEKEDLDVYKVPVGKSPVRGKATALVTIVEFSDFQCPFCGRVAPTLDQLIQAYGDKIRVVFKQNPLPFHPHAEPAAELALEARAQKGDAMFWKIHDELFKNQQHLEEADLVALATANGLDAKKVSAAITGHKYKAEIDADQDLADDLRASGTPHFFINGRRLVGAQPIEKFKEVIDRELKKAEALVQAGTPAAKVYDKIEAEAVPPPPLEKKVVPPPTKSNPSRGPANAKVVVQVFSDFQCPFCKRAHPTLAELEKAFPGKIRVVWRNLPLPMHQDAPLAAEAAMEAFQQKGSAGFWAMADLLFAAQTQPDGLKRASLEGMASQLGLDPQRFMVALDTRAHKAEVDADAQVANQAGISGTPAFEINGYFISGAQPLSKFKKVVQAALAGKK